MNSSIRSRYFWPAAVLVALALLAIGLVTVQSTSAQSATAVVNTGALNVRSGPGTQFSVVDVVLQGEVLTMIARTTDNSWVFVRTPKNIDGWVNAQYIIPSVPINTLPIIGAVTPTPTPVPGLTPTPALPIANVAVVNTGALNVRSGPSPSFTILTTVYQGDVLSMLGRNADGSWIYIATPSNVVGWVNAKYVIPSTSIADLPIIGLITPTPPPVVTATPAPPTAVPSSAVVTTGALNVRSGPGLSYSRVDGVDYGQYVTLMGRNLDATWIKVVTPNGKQGWVNGKYIATTINMNTLPVLTQTGTGIVVTGVLNVRSGPGPGYSILTSAPYGANMTLLGRTSDNRWLRLRAPDWTEGWSNGAYIATSLDLNLLPVLAGPVPTAPAVPGVPPGIPPVIPPPVDPGNTASLRACPNTACAVTGSVYSGLSVTATGRSADNTWIFVNVSNGQQGWIPAQYVALAVPIESLPVLNG
jgi:uncharacterized protein YgiM (DUF1202 family)